MARLFAAVSLSFLMLSGGASAANALGNTDDSPLLKVLEQAQALSNDQDRRLADALQANANSRSSTSKLFSLLQLQYELDDMHFNATLASGIASKLWSLLRHRFSAALVAEATRELARQPIAARRSDHSGGAQ